MMDFPNSPFGSELTSDDIVQTMQGFKGWEDKYRQVILWGKQLPAMPEELKSDQVLVSGCESQVWLAKQFVEGKWQFCADSDARIVRGLIAIVLAAFNSKTSQQIAEFDTENYFSQLGLIDHLSPSRGNGLKAIVDVIKAGC